MKNATNNTISDRYADELIYQIVRQACVDYMEYVCAVANSDFFYWAHEYFYGTRDVNLRDSYHLFDFYLKLIEEIDMIDTNRKRVHSYIKDRKHPDPSECDWMKAYLKSTKPVRWRLAMCRTKLEHLVEVMDFILDAPHLELLGLRGDRLLDDLSYYARKQNYTRSSLTIRNEYTETDISIEARRKNALKSATKRQRRDPKTGRFI